MVLKIYPKDFSDPRFISPGLRKLSLKKNKIHPLYEHTNSNKNNNVCSNCTIM
jgi:hypothetical protein